MGFTLIELLVVIAIIATLAAVVAPSLFGNVGEARRSAAKSQLEIMALALDAYRLDNDAFPATDQGLEALHARPVTGTPPADWKGPYLRQNIPLDPWKRPYIYASPGVANPNSYDLYTLGKDGKVGGQGGHRGTALAAPVRPRRGLPQPQADHLDLPHYAESSILHHALA